MNVIAARRRPSGLRRLWIAGGLTILLLGSPARAEEPAPPAPDEETTPGEESPPLSAPQEPGAEPAPVGLGEARPTKPAAREIEEFIVTATKREASAQSIPLSISVVSNAALQDMGADSFTDWARSVPNLGFADLGSGRTEVTLRGVAPIIGTAVGVYIDDIFVTGKFANPDPGLIDIERVEVLRGPQGTLWGEAALGGAIRYITKAPDPEGWAGQAGVTTSFTKEGEVNHNLDAVLNVPLVQDRAALRLVAYQRSRSGFLDVIPFGNRPRDDDANDEDTLGARISARLFATEALTLTAIASFQDTDRGMGWPVVTEKAGDLENRANFSGWDDDRYDQLTLNATYDLGFAELVSIYGSWESHAKRLFAIAGFTTENQLDNYRRVVSEEVRLTSKGAGPLRWTLGYYYKDEKQTADLIATTRFGFFTNQVRTIFHEGFETSAYFGEVSYDLSENLTATIGARRFGERRHAKLIDPGRTSFRKQRDRDLSPKFALNWRPLEDVLVYAVAAKGFRTGGVNPFSRNNRTYDADWAWSYELGAKSRWLDGRLQLNLAGFELRWDNLQVETDPTSGLRGGGVTNAGDAHSRGVEVETTAIPLPGLTVTLNGSFVEAELDEEAFTEAGQSAPDGAWLANVPRYSFSTSAAYTWGLTDSWDATLRAAYTWQGKSYAQVQNRDVDELPSYGLLNLRAELESDRYRVALFVDNALDRRIELWRNLGEAFVNQPITGGFSVSIDF